MAQQELKVKAAQKEAEDRKREKLADLEARKQVKLQIEADKKERAEKAAREKACVAAVHRLQLLFLHADDPFSALITQQSARGQVCA